MNKGTERRFLLAVLALVASCAAPTSRPPLAPPGAAQPLPALAGAWEGVLEVNGSLRLRAVLNLTHGVAGWRVTFDSPDQNTFGVPATVVVVEADHVRADIPQGPLSYEARVDGERLVGMLTWKGTRLPLTLTRRRPNSVAPGVVPAGTWAGAVQIAELRLRLWVKIKPTGTGWTATVDSVDQGARDIPVQTVKIAGDQVTLDLPGIGAAYAGRIAGDTISGSWTQNGHDFALDLRRRNRPQEPQPPFPYAELAVAVENRPAGATLACTLTEPRGEGPFAGVVLITGSGPQDRDEALAGHRPFLVLADALTRAGVAVLRCDDRGVGKSTGTFGTATTFDFVDDALAALEALRGRREIDGRHIGLLGHSEGALVATIAATKSKEVSFVVMLAGPALPGDETLDLQRGWIERASGLSDQQIAGSKANWDRAFAVLETEKEDAVAEKKLRALYDGLPEADRAKLEHAGGFAPLARQLLSPWFRTFVGLDPRRYLTRLRVPVLALDGQYDRQVLPDQNLPEMKKALKHDDDATVREVPGLNHLFQTAKTGALDEYEQIEETMAPAALTLVTDWVVRHTR
jgi:uncharacterized protein